MKIPKVANAIGHIDDDLIVSAAQSKKVKKNLWLRWGSVAACFAVLVIVGVAVLPNFFKNQENADDRYKDIHIQVGESAVVWPWEYKTIYEKYVTIDIDGNEFVGRAREVAKSYIGDKIGTYKATGYEDTEDGVYHESFDAYEIKGVSIDELIAVKMDGRYYVFISEKYDPPMTWGEVMDDYSLAEHVDLNRFSFEGKGVEDNYHMLNDDDYIWSILKGCASAKATDPTGWHEKRGDFVSFSVTSEALGVYKNVMYVTESGYVWTNAFNAEFLYNIGKDAAGKIIKYAKENSTKAEYEAYRSTVTGKIVEITKDYILVDDSILCKDPADGITYKILINDIRISRYVDMDIVGVGDIVVVSYEGTLNENVIDSAVSISKGIISGSDVLIPE